MTIIKRRSAACPTDCSLELAALLELASQVNKISAYFKDNWQIPFLEAKFAFDRDGGFFSLRCVLKLYGAMARHT
jgi:hypothetical protein